MTNDIPQYFDAAFLRWFRERTEETWRSYPTRTFENFVASHVGGNDWQQGTCWLGGLSEQEIATIEQRYQMPFPPDYRLFLQLLHSVDRPMVVLTLLGCWYTMQRSRMTNRFYNSACKHVSSSCANPACL